MSAPYAMTEGGTARDMRPHTKAFLKEVPKMKYMIALTAASAAIRMPQHIRVIPIIDTLSVDM